MLCWSCGRWKTSISRQRDELTTDHKTLTVSIGYLALIVELIVSFS